MNPQIILATVISALHDIFTAIWIGGMIVLAWAIRPAMRKMIPAVAERRLIVMEVQHRLRIAVGVSMLGLWITGMMMAKHSPMAHGLFSFGTPYDNVLSIKHILMFLMVFAAIGRTMVNKKLVKNPSDKLARVSVGILYVNIVFGVAVIFLSALLATFSWALA